MFSNNIHALRGLAVISVMLFHYRFEYFKGGFLGVDIFFVISGYLMSLLLDEKINYKIILKFYLKRLKRLLPALIFVLFISLLLGFLLMSDVSFARLGKTTLSSIFFTSNIYFWREWSYFDISSLNKPLLHTWSLSLEMQFYLLFPIFLVSIKFLKKQINIIYKLLFITILLIFLTELVINEKKVATFYLLPFRFSEFLIGSIGYYYQKNYRTLKLNNNFIFIISFGFLLFLITYYYDFNTKFPGLNSLLPCVATLILILHKENNLSKKLLQNRVFLFFGNISYSLYLIHWPVYVFYRFYIFREPSNFEKFSLVIFSIIFAYLISRYIENILRKKIDKKSNYFLSFSFVVIAICSILVFINNGYDFRIKNKKEFYDNSLTTFNFFKDSNKEKLFYKKCYTNSQSTNTDFIIYGDSHAEMYSLGVIEFAKKNNKNFCFVGMVVSCNLFKNIRDVDFIKSNCAARHKKIIEYFSKNEFPTLIIAHAWHIFDDNDLSQIGLKYNSFYKKIFKEVQKNIVFLLAVPNFTNGITSESCKNFPTYLIKSRNCEFVSTKAVKKKKNQRTNEQIVFKINEDRIGDILFLNPYDILCDDRFCKQVLNNEDVYFGLDHVTPKTGLSMINFWAKDLLNMMK